MTSDEARGKLTQLKIRIETCVGNIKRLSAELSSERSQLDDAVKGYGAQRIELVKQELAVRGQSWCTYCSNDVPEDQVELLLMRGNQRVEGGYENSCYGFHRFFKLHRACPTCREFAADRHGKVGEMDTQAHKQESFYAFRVEKRDDGYYAREFGQWVKLDSQQCQLDEPTDKLVDRLSVEWNLAPKVEFEWHHGDNDTLLCDGKSTSLR